MTRRLTMDLYLKQLKNRYIEANRKGKAVILNEFCQNTGFHRKHAIRLLTQSAANDENKHDRDGRGRKRIYHPEDLLAPLKQIWLATNQMCGKRLKAAIPIWLPFYGTPLITPPNTYKKYSDAERQSHCDNWKRSGLSMSEYCRQSGLAVSSLSKWINDEPNRKLTIDNLQEKSSITNNQSPSGIEIILVSGIRLRFTRTPISASIHHPFSILYYE